MEMVIIFNIRRTSQKTDGLLTLVSFIWWDYHIAKSTVISWCILRQPYHAEGLKYVGYK